MSKNKNDIREWKWKEPYENLRNHGVTPTETYRMHLLTVWSNPEKNPALVLQELSTFFQHTNYGKMTINEIADTNGPKKLAHLQELEKNFKLSHIKLPFQLQYLIRIVRFVHVDKSSVDIFEEELQDLVLISIQDYIEANHNILDMKKLEIISNIHPSITKEVLIGCFQISANYLLLMTQLYRLESVLDHIKCWLSK